MLDVYHTGPLVNPACTAVYRLTNVVLFVAWLSAPVRSWLCRFDWYWGRCIHLTEGVALVACTLLIRALGPSEHYPPGGMSLSAALARGGLAILLGGLVLSPPNRRRLARLANHLGVNHVVLSLRDIDLNPANRRDAYCEIRPPSIRPPSQLQGGAEDDTSASSLTSPRYSVPESHHTTKLTGPLCQAELFTEADRVHVEAASRTPCSTPSAPSAPSAEPCTLIPPKSSEGHRRIKSAQFATKVARALARITNAPKMRQVLTKAGFRERQKSS